MGRGKRASNRIGDLAPSGLIGAIADSLACAHQVGSVAVPEVPLDAEQVVRTSHDLSDGPDGANDDLSVLDSCLEMFLMNPENFGPL